MLTDEEASRRLASIGLRGYEARAYLALLKLAEARAAEVVLASRIPRGRVYDVLRGLHEKGLVDVIPVIPRRYRPAAPCTFLEKRKRELHAGLNEMERSLEAVTAPFSVQRRGFQARSGQFLLYQKRRAVMAQMMDMIEGATREILAVCSAACAIRLRDACLQTLHWKAHEGVSIRICTNITEEDVEAARSLEPAARLRHHDLGNRLVGVIAVDEDQVLLCRWNPDDGDLYHGDDVALWSNDRAVVEVLRSIAAEAWERGTDASVRYREIEGSEREGRVEFATRTEAPVNASGLVAKHPSRRRKSAPEL